MVKNGNKLRIYRQYKNVLKIEYYVKCNMSKGHKRIPAKFRSCNLLLATETGRYTKPETPIFGLLKYCDKDAIEDETHFLFECEF